MSGKAGANIGKEPLLVRHSGLERLGHESGYKSKCPSCGDGALLMRRDNVSLKLLREDGCVLCGQQVVYLDDNVMGEMLPPKVAAAAQ